ncbi:MAG: RagB/SusD family nutrient uptake outer membrane protein [Bacteroides sp.]|nr:RagB/SusD family nutrient uptake outer membrane protein [Bacteroides sp.]
MKLYKTLTLATAIGFATAMSGCSDWLDYTPKDKQLYEQQFSTAEGFHKTVNGIYTQLTSSSLYGYNLSYGPIDAMGLSFDVGQANNTMYQFKSANYTGDLASSVLTSIWSTAYNTILNANLVLQALEEFPDVLKEQDAAMIKAEMLAVRAYIHFDLTRIFGPIPSVKITGDAVPYADTPEATKRDRLPADVIINEHILVDLSEAQEIMKDYDPIINEGVLNTDGGSTSANWERYRQLRLNYYAVTLLKARAYLWLGDYPNALAEARKLTDDPNVNNVFPWVVPNKLLANITNPDCGFSTECLFGFYRNDISNIYKNSFSSSLSSDQLLQVRRNYINILFPATSDYRYQTQWRSAPSINAGYEFIKYQSFTPSSTAPEFWATFYGLLRLPEAYYIAAESALNEGDLDAARGYINTVLAARGVPDLDPSVTTANLQKEIELEYARELRGEGQSFFLLKRLNASVGEYYSPNKIHLDGSTGTGFDTPAKASRYNVPIPSGETY